MKSSHAVTSNEESHIAASEEKKTYMEIFLLNEIPN